MKLKLNLDLTEEQRTELQDSFGWIEKLLRQIAATEKKHATLSGHKTKATAKLVSAEKAADDGDLEASTSALALRDQIARLNLSMGRAERELADLHAEAAKAADVARNEIRTAHWSLLKPFTEELADLIEPFSYARHTAVATASELYAVQALNLWARQLPSYRRFQSPEELVAGLQAIGETLTALLAGKAVIALRTDGKEEGAFAFPC